MRYNEQIAVDPSPQITVAADVTQQANDCNQFVRMVLAMRRGLCRLRPIEMADPGNFSEDNLASPELADLDRYIARGRAKLGALPGDPVTRAPQSEAENRMREKLNGDAGGRR